MDKIKIAFFDAKDYDKNSFFRANSDGKYEIVFYETRLTKDTCRLAEGCDAVCVFVNDDVNREVIDELVKLHDGEMDNVAGGAFFFR